MKMRESIKSIIFCAISAVLFTGCGGEVVGNNVPVGHENSISGSSISGSSISDSSVSGSSVSGAGVMAEESKYCMTVSVGRENQVNIPDPSASGSAQISLNKEAKKYIDWEERPVEQKEKYFADLSFAGFREPVLVTSYAIGTMAKKAGLVSRVMDQDSGKTKEKKGNCLALLVTADVGIEDESESGKENYILVLDYANHTWYKRETGMFLKDLSEWCTMEFADLTGDGNEEIFIKCLYNKSVEFGAFSAKKGTHDLIRLFCTLPDDYMREDKDEEDDDRDYFSAELLDDYKVRLQYKDIGYSQTVSMIEDGGYQEKDLQVGSDSLAAFWKNGVLQRKRVDEDSVFLYTLDHIEIVKGKNGTSRLELVRGLFVGHRSEQIGNMHIYLKYDKKADKLVVGSVRYVKEDEALKEFDSFEEWQEQ